MEETRENEIPPTVRKDLDDGEGGIRRRLRDRDLLRKRKAEAEEKANQAQNTRKRERRETRGTTGKRGRPRKNERPTDALVPQDNIPSREDVFKAEVEMVPSTIVPATVPELMEPKVKSTPSTLPLSAVILEPLPVQVPAPTLTSVVAPAPTPALASLSAPIEDPVSLTVPAPAPVPFQNYSPTPVSVPVLPTASIPAFSPAVIVGCGSADEVLIEDLGPDEEEDLPPPQGDLIIDQEASEEPPVDVPDQNRMFSYPLFASPLQK